MHVAVMLVLVAISSILGTKANLQGGFYNLYRTESAAARAFAGLPVSAKFEVIKDPSLTRIELVELVPANDWFESVRDAYRSYWTREAHSDHVPVSMELSAHRPTDWLVHFRTIDHRHDYWIDGSMVEAMCLGGNLEFGPHGRLGPC